MPLYEYQCESCLEVFEEIRSSDDDREVRCPKCDAPAKKNVSRFSAWSRGASFYTGGSSRGGGGG